MPPQTATNLDDLSSLYPLPVEGCELETFSDTAIVSGVSIHLAGFATEFDGECITGSAASVDEVPAFRAYMELVERLSLIAAIRRGAPVPLRDADGARVGFVPASHVFPESPDPGSWKWARSNGVAVAGSWCEAAKRARWELIERDRVLRSFYGAILPMLTSGPDGLLPEALAAEYVFQTYAFDAAFGDDVHAAGVFGFPRGEGPLVFGFGARDTVDEAARAAAGECLQRLGFLAGEPLPDAPPKASPTPDFHQDYFLFREHQDALRRWLRGEHGAYRGWLRTEYAGAPGEPRYADLTPPGLEERLSVARAIPNGHLPLAFGVGLPLLVPLAPGELSVHPIA